MKQALQNDLDFLAARLHGRRSRLAEADKLDELCRLRHIPELASALYQDQKLQTAADLQRRWVQDLADELSWCCAFFSGAAARLLTWMLVRFQVENVKVLLREVAGQGFRPLPDDHLVFLPKKLALNPKEVGEAGSLAGLVKRLGAGSLQKSLEELVREAGEPPKLFFLEAALDRGYFRELLARASWVSGTDADVIRALVWQEVDMFHLALAIRGGFHYGLAPPPDRLIPFHIRGARISRSRFAVMLRAPDRFTAVKHAIDRALDRLPRGWEATGYAEPVGEASAAPEASAWNRYLRLANRAFRQSHLGLGAVIGYVGVRRVEVANLITLSEGIRAGLPAEVIRGRLIPRSEREATHV